MENELRRSDIFRVSAKQMSPLRGFALGVTVTYIEVAPTALSKTEMYPEVARPHPNLLPLEKG
jgi:hypothetical protein